MATRGSPWGSITARGDINRGLAEMERESLPAAAAGAAARAGVIPRASPALAEVTVRRPRSIPPLVGIMRLVR